MGAAGRSIRAVLRPIAIFNVKGEFFGLLNRCPHQGAALCEGPLIGLAQSSDPGEIEYTKLGEIIRCPWRGREFDIRTGQSYCDPDRTPWRTSNAFFWIISAERTRRVGVLLLPAAA
jgi:nitrite reductase/ring-hydroxylating ferredoxin subunit